MFQGKRRKQQNKLRDGITMSGKFCWHQNGLPSINLMVLFREPSHACYMSFIYSPRTY